MSLPRKRRWRRRGARTLRPIQASDVNHVWSYDILHDCLANGRQFKCLRIVDEYIRENLAIQASPSMTTKTVIQTLERLM